MKFYECPNCDKVVSKDEWFTCRRLNCPCHLKNLTPTTERQAKNRRENHEIDAIVIR